jgi:hypothetical protein
LQECFVRVEPWLQGGKYVAAVASGLAKRNGWTIAEEAGGSQPAADAAGCLTVCYLPQGQSTSKTRLIRAAGLRWPVEEGFEFSKACFGLDESQVRLYHAIARHTVLVMAALAVSAVTAALLRDRTDTKLAPAGTTSAPGSPATPKLLWSASEWRLPY